MAFMLARFELSAFLPVGTPKNLVYAPPDINEEALHHLIEVACQTIRNYPGTFERIRLSKMGPVEARIVSHEE
jgi:hypothetical protein